MGKALFFFKWVLLFPDIPLVTVHCGWSSDPSTVTKEITDALCVASQVSGFSQFQFPVRY